MAHYNPSSIAHIRHNPDYIYYDMVVRNYDSPTKDSEIPLAFCDTRDVAIVPNASDYKMSVIRFQVDTFADVLPIMIFQVQRDQPDRDLGIYTVTFEYEDLGGNKFTTQPEPVIWSPQEKNAKVPNPPSLTGNTLQEFSEYYYMYNFQYMISLINDALERCMDKLKAIVTPILNTVNPPFLTWDDNQLSTMHARESHFDTDVFPQVRMYFNRSLYSLLSSLPSVKFDISNPKKKYYQLIMKRYNGAKVVEIQNTGIDRLIIARQEYSTVNQFSPVSSVMFMSSTLPIIPTYLSNPAVYIDGQPINLTNTYNNSANIITDISSDEMAYKPELLFVPSAQYRFIDLQNDTPINQVDIQTFWRDKLGIVRPFYLAPNSSASLKILFQKKKLGDSLRKDN
ncbi:MAG: phage minor capsid protein [Promethearchaeota archaeon]|jgi:hypothetical protein